MFEIEWLTHIFPEYKINEKNKEKVISSVTTDSRTLKENSLFIPLIGDNFDGHAYANQAIEKGSVAILWNHETPLSKIPENISVFFVKDTLKALQLLAFEYRKLVNPKVIGITGSNGKTTTKDLLKATLTKTYITKATEGNYNNHIGLPLTILNTAINTEVLILEMGMSDFKEIELLSYIAMPDIAIITNIGESHIEYLGSRKGISQAKLEITKYMNEESTLIIDGDEPLLENIDFKGKVIRCGFSKTNEYLISDIKLQENGTLFTLNNNHYEIPLLGSHHAKNASFAIAVSELLKLNYERIQEGLNQTEITNMRFELLDGGNNTTLINDAYNASPTSMKAGIEVVEDLQGYNEKILVLGDILELGVDIDKYYQEISNKIMKTNIKKIYTYGDDSIMITQYLNKKSQIEAKHFKDKNTLIKMLKRNLTPGNLMFFKASRGIKLEDIIEQLK